MLIFILVILQTSQKKTPDGEPITCGIPVLMWLQVFFGAFGLRSLANLLKIYIIRNHSERVLAYDMAKLILIDGLLIVWLIYGN